MTQTWRERLRLEGVRYETDPIHPRRVTSSGPPDFVTGVLPKCPSCPLPAGHEDDHELKRASNEGDTGDER